MGMPTVRAGTITTEPRRPRARRGMVLDHLLWAGPDLAAAVEDLQEQSGVRAAPGSSHRDLGTHDALVCLGGGVFLEVIAPDPSLPQGAFAKQLSRLGGPVLMTWAAKTADAAALAARAEAAGYRAVVTEGRRSRPDGTVARWKNVFVTGHGAGTLVPFFVEWADDASHPSADAPVGLDLVAFRIEVPRPAALRAVLEALGVTVSLRKGPRDRLVAEIATPRGPMTLSGPPTA